MEDLPHAGLLPAGFRDVLPPEAAHEAAVVERILALLDGHGYERVAPPLVEFEATLLAGMGAAMTGQTFRLMDPVSQRMMGLRADMTVQVARIAATRLASAPRPLRLSYGGPVLQVRGTQLRPERQFLQVGAELIGAAEPVADAEVARLAASALAAVGVERLSLDVGLPALVPALFRAVEVPAAEAAALRRALDRKDDARVAASPAPLAPLLRALLAAGGPAERALDLAAALDLPGDEAAAQLGQLDAVLGMIRAAVPDLALTVDFVEFRGFEYHTGVSFTLFARDVRGELGRGGRYRAVRPVDGAGAAGEGEPATGFTLYMDSVMRAVPSGRRPPRLYVPFGAPPADAARSRTEGFATVAGLAPAADARAEARRLGCAYLLQDGAAQPLEEPS